MQQARLQECFLPGQAVDEVSHAIIEELYGQLPRADRLDSADDFTEILRDLFPDTTSSATTYYGLRFNMTGMGDHWARTWLVETGPSSPAVLETALIGVYLRFAVGMPGRQTGIFDIILRVYPRATSDDYAQTITGVNFAGPALLPTEPVRVGRAFGTPPPATAHPAPMLSIEDSSLDLDLASRPEPRLAHRQATTKLWQGRSAGEILTFDGLPEYPPASLADFQKAASGKAIDTARVYRVGEEVGGQDARAAFFKTCQYSYGGGSGGAAEGNINVEPEVFGLPSSHPPVRCSKVSRNCQGCKHCPDVDFTSSTLVAAQHSTADLHDLARLEAARQATREATVADSLVRLTALQYLRLASTPCAFAGPHGQCAGKWHLRRNDKVDHFGSRYQVHCSESRIDAGASPAPPAVRRHTVLNLSTAFDPVLLTYMLDSDGQMPVEYAAAACTPTGGCFTILGANSRMLKCPLAHDLSPATPTAPATAAPAQAAPGVPSRRIGQPRLVKRPCPNKMFLVVPLDASIGKVLYISWGSHNHPPPSPTKMSAVARAALRSVLRQSGGVGAGLGQLQAHVLRYAPLVLDPVFGIGSGSTSSGIMDLHPTLGTSEMLARTIRKERQRAVVTEDMTLDELLAYYQQHEHWRPAKERYIQHAEAWSEPGQSRRRFLFVLAHPYLMSRATRGKWPAVDTTFKTLHGSQVLLFRISIWDAQLEMRLTPLRVIYTAKDEAGFARLWSAVGTTWSSLTGVPLEFAELAPTSPATALNGICADFELAPLTQLADYLFEHLADAALKARLAAITLFERRSYVLLRMFTPCANHWRASVDRLNLDATQPDQRALRRGLRHLPYATKEEAVAIIQDARASVFVKVQDWVANKDTQPYDVWTAVVRAASPMHADRRATAPRSSNLVEGDHPEDNRNIGTRLNAGVFVSRARGVDQRDADSIRQKAALGLPQIATHHSRAKMDKDNQARNAGRLARHVSGSQSKAFKTGMDALGTLEQLQDALPEDGDARVHGLLDTLRRQVGDTVVATAEGEKAAEARGSPAKRRKQSPKKTAMTTNPPAASSSMSTGGGAGPSVQGL